MSSPRTARVALYVVLALSLILWLTVLHAASTGHIPTRITDCAAVQYRGESQQCR